MSSRRRAPLHITLLTLISVMLAAALGIVTSYNFLRNSESAIDIADTLMAEVSNKEVLEFETLFDPVVALAQGIVELPGIAVRPELLSHPATWYLTEALISHPYIYSVYIGYKDDDFYQIISLNRQHEAARDLLLAPDDARFAIRRIMQRPDGRRVEIWKFLDNDRRVVGSSSSVQVSYRPTSRPWYARAEKTDEVIRTAPYPFSSTRSLGITVARRFDGDVPGVFGLDLTLDSLSAFLAKQHVGNSGYAILFNGSGDLLAHPVPGIAVHVIQQAGRMTMSTTRLPHMKDPVVNAFYEQFMDLPGHRGRLRFTVNEVEYIARITPVDRRFIDDAFVVVVAPVRDFTEAIIENRDASMVVAALVMAISLLVVLLMSRVIASRLQLLSLEAEKIRDFDLSDPVEITSRITEIHRLAQTFGAMKSALRTFGQYVPRSLVRQIVTRNLSPELGGTRQPLSILFTDVAGFTAISESMDPESLMLQASEYFQAVGATIIGHNGTIDKFIGDAIMAFWNAPAQEPEHASKACAAALAAAEVSNAQNAAWAELGKPVFHTRFGLHCGECIVGNVGSSDRMDYTAIGDTVNLASRLEGLNKHFHTQILASGTIREQAEGKYRFRPVGRVVPKGKTLPTDIFELVGPLDAKDDVCFAQWQQAYDLYMARRFEEAVATFAAWCAENPQDRPACMYRDRAQAHIQNPPPESWDGVEIFQVK